MCTGCISDNQQQASEERENLQPAPIEEVAEANEVQEVTGVAFDGAMNSIYLKVGDDTVAFSYPDLTERPAWEINDTVTVRYVETATGEDSVIQVRSHDIS